MTAGRAEMATDDAPSFGVLLARFRAAGGLTQEELAERAGLSVRGIGDLERGIQTRPRTYTVGQLAQALQLSPEDRAAFEQAARVARDLPTVDEVLPKGNFLGALPVTPLVAREDESERIRRLLSAASDGRGHLLLFGGEVGAGKTRLLQAVVLEARTRNFVVATGRCAPAEQRTPYYPFLQALAEVAERAPARSRTACSPIWKRVQQLASRHPDEEAAQPEAVIKQQLCSAVGELVKLVGRSRCLALLLDDLHWADTGSLRLLHFLAQRAGSAPLLLAGAYCDAHLGEQHPELARLLQDLSRERLAEQVIVRRLSLDETTQLVALTMGGQEVSEEFASYVYRRTKGNPRLIDGLVRSLGGRLELQEEIGAGSMGRVFRAFDRTSSETVAAKLVLARSAIDVDALLRWQHEGAVLAKLRHPHIVRVLGTFAEEHASCIIMELLEGQSLGEILLQGALPLSRAKYLGQQVAEALTYAHNQEIIHRDIKPDNVMVLSGDQVKVTDFGIARILQPDTSLQTIATTGMRMGTPLYMAPEQIEGKKIDGRTDIYALGAMLYHMVTGSPPFNGGDALAVAVKHLQEEPISPSQIKSDVPADWDALIVKSIAKDPKRRFQSAREMETAIDELSEDGESSPRTAYRRQWLLTVAGLFGALLVGMAAMFVHGATTPVQPSLTTRIDAYLSGLAARGRLSGTVLVARKHEIVLDRGYGFANRELHSRNGPITRYGIGFSRNLTTISTMRLIETGLVHWQDRICAYLSRCPTDWKSITVRMVIDGTSRLPAYQFGHAGATTRDAVAACQAEPLDGTSNGKIDYQICNTEVLGTIIEKVTGFPWSEDGTFDGAGMHNSGRLTDAILPPARAVDYDGATADRATTYDDYFAAYSTAPDLYAFDNALFGGNLLSRAMMHRLFTPRLPVDPPDPGFGTPRWGYYWKVGTIAGRRVIYTIGRLNDYQTVNLRFPQDGLTVVLMSNDIQNDAARIAIGTAELVFGRHSGSKATNSQLSAFHPPLGSYHRVLTAADIRATGDTSLNNLLNGTFRITVYRGRIHLTVPDGGTVDEYYDATAGRRLALVGYLPYNQNSFCSVIPTQTPPTGYYRWSATTSTLTIQRIHDAHCPDRPTMLVGTWIKSQP